MAFVINPVGVDSTAVVGDATAEHIVLNLFNTHLVTDMNDTFFNSKEFAESAQYTHKVGGLKTYSVIFDDPTTNVNFGGGAATFLQKPQIQVKEKLLLNEPQRGDTCVVRGVRYRVENYISNGVGIMTIFLNRV